MPNSPEQLAKLRNVRSVLFDMDGVLYVGSQPLPGVQEFFNYLDATGRQWLCVTNNSSRTSITFSEKLAGMNVSAPPKRIFGSAQATANHLAALAPQRGKVIVMGEESLQNALADQGFDLVTDPFIAEYAVASICFGLSYDLITDVNLAIRNGAKFIATNSDKTLPTERGQLPGTGSLVALLTSASGVEPEFVGKPYPAMFHQAMQLVGTAPQETLMIGDRYETDIVGAIELGMPTAGVLTGVSTREEYAAAAKPPDIVVEDLPELLALMREL